MSIMPCGECGSMFDARNSRHKFCSDKCRYAAKDRLRGVPCAVCGEPMQRSGSLVVGVSKHQGCGHSYRRGCRCRECKDAQALKMREYAASVKEKRGAHPTTLSRRKFREDNGYWPNRRGSDWISDKTRIEIYERDGWACHICSEPVDRTAHFNDNLAPSLDHLKPKSLGGSHDPSNLKTAHRVCNSLKGAIYELA